MISVRFKGKPFNITVIQVYAPKSNDVEAEVDRFYDDRQDLLEPKPKKHVLYVIVDWKAKVGCQETPGVTGKFCSGVWNEVGQRPIEFCKENTLVIQTTSSNNTRKDSTHGHHHMVNTEIRLIISFAAKDGEALYSQQNKTGS